MRGWTRCSRGLSQGGVVLVAAGLVVVVGVCGLGFSSRAQAAASSFRSVSAGVLFTCAVRSDEHVVCWGLDNYGQGSPPAVTFSSVSTGLDHACGVRTDGLVDCWGDNRHGEALPPR